MTININNKLEEIETKNNSLFKNLTKLQNNNNAADKQLKETNYIYNQIYKENIILMSVIASTIAIYIYIKYK